MISLQFFIFSVFLLCNDFPTLWHSIAEVQKSFLSYNDWGRKEQITIAARDTDLDQGYRSPSFVWLRACIRRFKRSSLLKVVRSWCIQSSLEPNEKTRVSVENCSGYLFYCSHLILRCMKALTWGVETYNIDIKTLPKATSCSFQFFIRY